MKNNIKIENTKDENNSVNYLEFCYTLEKFGYKEELV